MASDDETVFLGSSKGGITHLDRGRIRYFRDEKALPYFMQRVIELEHQIKELESDIAKNDNDSRDSRRKSRKVLDLKDDLAHAVRQVAYHTVLTRT